MDKYYQLYLEFFAVSVILVLVLQTFLSWPYGFIFALGYFVVFPLLFKKIKIELDHFGNNTRHTGVKYQCKMTRPDSHKMWEAYYEKQAQKDF